MRSQIIQRIKEVRKQKNISQEGLAWGADIDRSFMCRIEKGKADISVLTLEQIICEGLEMSIKDFFDSEIFSHAKNNPETGT